MEQSQVKNNVVGWWKKVVFDNYANFNGRARRSEYWYFVLGNILLFLPVYALIIIGAVLNSSIFAMLGAGVIWIIALGLILPGIAVSVRRLHDLNKSGWFYLLNLVPIANIVLLVWFFTEGTKGDNQYGPDPKGSAQFDFERTESTPVQ